MSYTIEALISGIYFSILGILAKKFVNVSDSMQSMIIIFFITGVITYMAIVKLKPDIYPIFK